MNGELNREEIITFLSDKSNRKKIIDSVLNSAQNILYEIGMNNLEIAEICGRGSYIKSDPKGRWPRIVLPQYPEIYVPSTYFDSRGDFGCFPSDFDVVVITDDAHNLKDEFFNPLRKRDNVKASLERFRMMTGVEMDLKVITGVLKLGKKAVHEYIFGNEKYVVMYRRSR